jgi:hypothetical protein
VSQTKVPVCTVVGRIEAKHFHALGDGRGAIIAEVEHLGVSEIDGERDWIESLGPFNLVFGLVETPTGLW